jgi:hypothetical protein
MYILYFCHDPQQSQVHCQPFELIHPAIKPTCAGNALLISRIFVQNKIARLYAGEQLCYCI